MTASKTQIKSAIITLLQNIAPEANFANLTDDQDLRVTLGIDSFDFLNLMIGLDESFGISIPEADYGKLLSLSNMIDYIENSEPNK